MQMPFRARRGDVEEARVLVALLFPVEPADVFVGGVLVASGRIDRSEKELRTARVSEGRSLHPNEKLALVAAGARAEPGDDDGVEFQALRLVYGEYLRLARSGVQIGQRVEVIEPALERRGIGELARLFGFLEGVEVDLGVLNVGVVLDARRPAQREPGILHALAQGAAQPVRQGPVEHFPETRKTQPAIREKAGKRCLVSQTLPESSRVDPVASAGGRFAPRADFGKQLLLDLNGLRTGRSALPI